jgi:hypothetical protein
MAGYDDTYNMIISTLMGRPAGTEIQPENHQAFALNMLEYIRSLELLANAPFIGVATPTTQPVQPDDSRACYIAGVAQDRTTIFQNFRDMNGDPISITNGEMEACLVIFVWNAQYWSAETVPTNIISSADQAYFFYNLTIRKTYNSVSDMNADVSAPVGNDGKYIKVGEIVSVHNEDDPTEDAIYSWEEGPRWQLQMKLSALDSRVFDGGRADSKYGGARNIDCGTAQG